MLLRLFLLFTLVPILELALLLRVGAWIGWWPTLALVVATGLAGAAMARHQGLRSWRSVQMELAAGRLPGTELMHGMLILVAAALLVTPGVLTDATGLLMLVRPARAAALRLLRRRFEAALLGGTTVVVGRGFGPPGREAEFTEEAGEGDEVWYRSADGRAEWRRRGSGDEEDRSAV